jgi:FtsP/CotA-like multicopper oxidase with cupredoxin domain
MSDMRTFLSPLTIRRRRLLQLSGGTAAYLAFSRRGWPFAQSPKIRKFIVNLPGLGPAGANQIGQYLPLASKTTTNFAGKATDVYKLGVAQFGQKMHPDLPRATLFWGYYDLATGDQKYLGGVIVAKRGTPVLLNVTNQLPNKTIIPVDPTIEASPTQTVGQPAAKQDCDPCSRRPYPGLVTALPSSGIPRVG